MTSRFASSAPANSAAPNFQEPLQVVLQLLGMLLPAMTYWSWRAAHLDSQARPLKLVMVMGLVSLAVPGLYAWRKHGLDARKAGILTGLALLAWLLAVAAFGGGVQMDLLAPFMATVTLAVSAGLWAAGRALAETRAALLKANAKLERLQPDEPIDTLFSQVFELSPLSMGLSRISDGVFLALNHASFQLQGYAPQELLGRSALELGTWTTVAQREAFIEKVRRHQGRFEAEMRLPCKDGSWVDCRVWATVVDVEGEACLLSTALDISQQKQRETSLLDLAESLASAAGEPFFRSAARYLSKVMNADLVMLAEINPPGKLATLALWKDQAQVANTTFDLADAPFADVLADVGLVSQSHPTGLRYPAVFNGAEDVFHACVGQVLRDADGTPIGLVCLWWRDANASQGERTSLFRIMSNRSNSELVRLRRDREIFQLKDSMEQRVLARTEQLRATNAELESFGYSVSHDLQSPLRSIQGFLFLLERRIKGRLSTEEGRLIERINANVTRMHELISDLLALARVSRDQLVRESVDLSAIAERVLADLRLAEPQRQVRAKIAPGLMADCDAKLTRIVLENLLGNAWKYSRNVALSEIEFGVMPSAADAAATFFVRDNGAGFSMEFVSSLFKPFHRLHHEDEFEGSGIGLATVHRILERHGGSIRAEAVEGQGACFYFTFACGHGSADA